MRQIFLIILVFLGLTSFSQPLVGIISSSQNNVASTPSILTNGLIAYWKFDEIAGTTLIDFNGHSNLTLSGGVVNQTGKLGKAVLFDTNTDYSRVVPNSTLTGYTDKITFRCWFKLNTLPSTTGSYMQLVNLRNTDGTYAFRVRLYNTSSFIRATTRNNSGALVSSDGVTYDLSVGVWYHLVVVSSAGTTTKIYLNGENVTTDSTGSLLGTIPAFTNYLYVGNEVNDTNAILGLIDEPCLFSVAWSSTDVTIDYNSGNGLTP